MMLVYDYKEHFHFLIGHHLLVYANIYTIFLNHDWLMGYFYEILVYSIAPKIGILLNGLFFPNSNPFPFLLHLDLLHMED